MSRLREIIFPERSKQEVVDLLRQDEQASLKAFKNTGDPIFQGMVFGIGIALDLLDPPTDEEIFGPAPDSRC